MYPAGTAIPRYRHMRTSPSPVVHLCTTALLCLALVGCTGDYCITGIFNPTGIVTGTNNPCVDNKLMGNVSVRIATAAASGEGPMAPNLLHVFVTVQGIEAHPDATAADDSPDWEELAPDLVREPMQIDLLAHAAESCASNRAPTAVAAGAYRQVRVRLVAGTPTVGKVVSPENACGSTGFHCAVSLDGHVHPLALDGGVTALRVAGDGIAGGFLQVLPGTDTHFTIKFNPFASFAAASGDTVQLSPAFNVSAAAPCGKAVTLEP
jgi:hypothetical protein